MGKVKGISHITLICSDLNKTARLLCGLFEAVEVYSSQEKNFSLSREKFFLIGELWIALMEGPSTERSYNHIAFRVEEEDLPLWEARISALELERVSGRPRDVREGKSIYFYDYDNHLFELHTGDLATRLEYYYNQHSSVCSSR
ncbi:MAG TPA: FosX/FosE/FosI family fosfomycin resistance hydrolase [Rhabdochlamydiaceae bacterium]|jgi:catechol 2,3-dioxygenase-like lactoylglutathione lyase family enzyme